MGARLNVVFHSGNEAEPTCTIYGHWAGDNPEDAAQTLKQFFEAVEAQTNDHRYTDAGYLAAKYVVFLALECGNDPKRPLDFLSVGCYRDAQDCGPECIAFMDCGNIDPTTKRPTIRFEDEHAETEAMATAYGILGQTVPA
jgi:hypothetical protein